jgi:oligopeptide/dipeptide ABC transporter ATP-binding protein
VESGPVEEVLKNPQHAYTKALLACVPRMGAKKARLPAIDHAALSAAG